MRPSPESESLRQVLTVLPFCIRPGHGTQACGDQEYVSVCIFSSVSVAEACFGRLYDSLISSHIPWMLRGVKYVPGIVVALNRVFDLAPEHELPRYMRDRRNDVYQRRQVHMFQYWLVRTSWPTYEQMYQHWLRELALVNADASMRGSPDF